MRRVAVILLLFVCGCGEAPLAPPVDTGAKESAQSFFDGLIANDARRSYDTLNSDSRRRVSFEQFTQLVQAYSRNVAFAADRVHIRSCEEQGDSATVHVLLIGHSTGHSRRFEDGITLRRAEGRWGVVLPANFGRKTR